MITKKGFCDSINTIRDYWDWSMQIYKFFDTYPDSTPSMEVMDRLVELLELETNDKDSKWIFYYCWELDFGRLYHDGMICDKDGKFIPLATAENLWDLLTKGTVQNSSLASNDFNGIIE